MYNAMRTSKRSLAAVAAGALAFAGLAFVAAPSAQAAQTISVYCSNTGGGGDGGTSPDVTTIQPNCTLASGLTTEAEFDTTFVGTAAAYAYMTLTVSGDSSWVSADDTNITISDSSAVVAAPNTNLADLTLTVPTAGTRTVTITGGPTALVQDQVDLGTLTVTGTGTGATKLVNQGYYAVDGLEASGDAALALVHILDANGVPLSLAAATVSNLTWNTDSGTISTGLYSSGDCDTDGLLTDYDEGNTAAADIVTDACDVVTGAGIGAAPNLGLWVFWDAPAVADGTYTATFDLTLGASTYPVSVSYVVSGSLAYSATAALDKPEYAKGAAAAFTLCLKDVNGRITPDGTGWASVSGGVRDIAAAANAVITSPTSGTAVAPDNLFTPVNEAATYNGCTNAAFNTPTVDMANFVFSVESLATSGWTSAAADGALAVSASARIGESQPVEPTIMIVGQRGSGDESNMVFVEGTATDLTGSTVTPYFRFPGQTGMTAGTGVRTVDAEGNFQWQRKTGKRISVQFRSDDVKSNTVIIGAR